MNGLRRPIRGTWRASSDSARVIRCPTSPPASACPSMSSCCACFVAVVFYDDLFRLAIRVDGGSLPCGRGLPRCALLVALAQARGRRAVFASLGAYRSRSRHGGPVLEAPAHRVAPAPVDPARRARPRARGFRAFPNSSTKDVPRSFFSMRVRPCSPRTSCRTDWP